MDNGNELSKRYPWLKITTSVENYIKPDYYDKLLKNYVFRGISDLDYLRRSVGLLKKNEYRNILELGCGNGRASKIVLDRFPGSVFDLVDLSPRMLRGAKSRFSNRKTTIRYVRSDSIKYLENIDKVYDFVFSLWSFSHSTHQNLSKFGLRKGRVRIEKAIKKFVFENTRKGSIFFLTHFDSLSDEQKILMRQWRKVYPIFRDTRKQSPSKRYIDEILHKLERDGIIKLSIVHYRGNPIRYRSLDEALEIFMNFHMESFFNGSPLAGKIIRELSDYFNGFREKDGTVSIAPGCFVYKFIKL